MKKSQKFKAMGLAAMAVIILALLFAAMACERQGATDSTKEAAPLAGPAFGQEPVIIGVMGPVEGEAANYGRSLLHAAQILAQKANRQGGLCGQRVEIISEDDSCMAEQAVSAAKLLVNANPHAVIGPVCSTSAMAVLDIYQEAETVVISPCATEISFTQSGLYPLFFRTIAPDDAQARLMADFAVSFLGAQRIAVVAGFGVYDTMQAEFAAGFLRDAPHAKVVLLELFAPDRADWQELAERIGAVDAQALIFFGHPSDSAQMLAAMRNKGLETAFVADQRVAADKAFAKEAGDYSAGVFACLLPNILENPLAEKLVLEYRDIHFAEPSPFYLNAYAALQALFEALEISGCQKGALLASALRAGKTETPLGSIGFDDTGEMTGHGFEMQRLQGGRFVALGVHKPLEPALPEEP
ncbi:MAG: branched-chain amino acid ABC transporter substrate-binding protein [Desulfatibacillaceae bacterium]|nr:branched-chain amino acid ABC transporter substrate-binding protein [Desulfatibacillaceae bacterium]